MNSLSEKDTMIERLKEKNEYCLDSADIGIETAYLMSYLDDKISGVIR